MEKFKFDGISGCKWTVENKKAVVVISHGMAEHVERYDYFAQQLNKDNIEVWGINQVGHGDAIVNDLKGHWEKGGFELCVDNLNKLVIHVSSNNIPVILFGHSMGSFISQRYIQKYGDSIKAVVLSGSAKTGLLHKVGNLMAKLQGGELTKPNTFMNGMSFGSYNNCFKPNRTEFDWLSRDNEQVDKYIADPLCGYCCTTGFFKAFMHGLAHLNDDVKNIRKDLPIYIMSGNNDPVGNNGKDVLALNKMYKDLEIKDVEMILYPDGRHEMLNEINKDEVISNIKNWINNHL